MHAEGKHTRGIYMIEDRGGGGTDTHTHSEQTKEPKRTRKKYEAKKGNEDEAGGPGNDSNMRPRRANNAKRQMTSTQMEGEGGKTTTKFTRRR